MGFGSYDESDQREPDIAAEAPDEEATALHRHDHDGTASFEPGASTDDLVDRLAGIRADADE